MRSLAVTVPLAILVGDVDRNSGGPASLEPAGNWIDQLRELLPWRNKFNAAEQLQVGDAFLSVSPVERLIECRRHAVGAPRADIL